MATEKMELIAEKFATTKLPADLDENMINNLLVTMRKEFYKSKNNAKKRFN